MTIAEIREYYRTATDKDLAIRQLAISEKASEKMIRCYVLNATPDRVDAVKPVAVKQKIGRPVKNLKPTREPATPKESKGR